MCVISLPPSLSLSISSHTDINLWAIQARTNDVGLEAVPTDHTVLNVVLLKEDADDSFNTLLEMPAKPTTSSTNILATIGILSIISRCRPTYMPRAVEMLVNLHKTPPKHLKASQVNSVHRALKAPLMSILKHASSAELHNVLVPVLEDIGVPLKDISDYDMRGQLRLIGRGGAGAAGTATTTAKEDPGTSTVTTAGLLLQCHTIQYHAIIFTLHLRWLGRLMHHHSVSFCVNATSCRVFVCSIILILKYVCGMYCWYYSQQQPVVMRTTVVPSKSKVNF